MVMARATVVTVVISRLLDLDARRDWLPARHEGAEQLRTRSAVRCLKELRFELNLPPYRPIKAPERTPLARMR
jgi:hypothetical protein